MISEVSDLEISQEFSNAPSALEYLKVNKVNLIFLDIQMSQVSGLEFAESVPEDSLIIFVTAFSKYAVESYELGAVDYLLKPFGGERLKKAIDKASVYVNLLSPNTLKSKIQAGATEFLMIKSDRRFYKVNFSDIKFIEGLKDYVVIHTMERRLITAMNLKNIHQRIPLANFMRVSKSYVINTDFVDSFDNSTIFLGEHEIPVGEIYKNDFVKSYSGGLLLG